VVSVISTPERSTAEPELSAAARMFPSTMAGDAMAVSTALMTASAVDSAGKATVNCTTKKPVNLRPIKRRCASTLYPVIVTLFADAPTIESAIPFARSLSIDRASASTRPAKVSEEETTNAPVLSSAAGVAALQVAQQRSLGVCPGSPMPARSVEQSPP
jgi:hypothetical protein